VNGSLFGPERSRVAVAHYRLHSAAGTQGKTNHHKKDRLFEIVEEQRIPLSSSRGRRGRPGDVDVHRWRPQYQAFHIFGASAACRPGRHQLGPLLRRQRSPARLLRRVIATKNSSSHGRAGDDRGGNLGVFSPEEVGPMSVQVPNARSTSPSKTRPSGRGRQEIFSYFQGALPEWRAADQRLLRRAIPRTACASTTTQRDRHDVR